MPFFVPGVPPMPIRIYNFKPRFPDPIRAGIKDQTMRNPRRRETAVGDIVRLQFGPRFRPRLLGYAHCVWSGWAELCFSDPAGVRVLSDESLSNRDPVCKVEDPEVFARRDGFENWDDLTRFPGWSQAARDGLRIVLRLIRWAPPPVITLNALEGLSDAA